MAGIAPMHACPETSAPSNNVRDAWNAQAQMVRAELQENMAQSLAAAKLYLDLAERENDCVLLAQAKELVSQVIYEMMRLTRQLPDAPLAMAV